MAQLLSNLPIGAKVKFGKHRVGSESPWEIKWLIVAKSHSGYPANSVTLLSERIIDCVAFDAAEPSNTNAKRKLYGNNRYSLSNVDQWLNSANASWYAKTHSADAPPSPEHLMDGQSVYAYATRNGFLYDFTREERAAILDSTIRVVIPILDGGGHEDISRKVFLPSNTEIRNVAENEVYEGAQFEWFVKNPSPLCPVDPLIHYPGVYGSTSVSSPWAWATRTASSQDSVGGENTRCIGSNPGEYFNSQAYASSVGIRPALNLSSTLKVSDTTDSEGYYTFILNTAPPKPTTITTPTIYGGKSNTISWGGVTDPDGDSVTYQLECSVNGGGYEQIYSGTSLSYVHLVTFGTSTVSYRVKATDPSGESSAYTTSAALTVINNNAPVISGSDANLGVKSDGFTGTYTISDANNNAVTVTEAIDGVQIRAFVATLGATVTYGVTGTTWLALSNGSHTLTIRATDGIDTTVRTYTFTKLANSFTIRNSTPWVSNAVPSRIMLVVTRNIPTAATFKVEVCNNGFDAVPTWEDATTAVKNGLVHVFTNQNTTVGKWGVLVRVTVERNGATGACYVSAIGGNFE